MSCYRVQLRNQLIAVVTRLGDSGPAPEVGPFVWLAAGTIEDPTCILGHPVTRQATVMADLWRADGCWREDGDSHPLDIVAGLEETQ